MEHQRRVDTLEGPRLDQPNLAGAAHLLGGGAEHGDGAGVVGQRPEDRDRRRGGTGRDEVVAAAVPQAGQCVVLGEYGDVRSGTAPLVYGGERRLHPAQGRPHREARLGEPVGQQLPGVELGELQLGAGVDGQADRLHPGPERGKCGGEDLQRRGGGGRVGHGDSRGRP
ncbi:hypothetical protein GCM10027615_50760 [Plantactinospora veratri]